MTITLQCNIILDHLDHYISNWVQLLVSIQFVIIQKSTCKNLCSSHHAYHANCENCTENLSCIQGHTNIQNLPVNEQLSHYTFSDIHSTIIMFNLIDLVEKKTFIYSLYEWNCAREVECDRVSDQDSATLKQLNRAEELNTFLNIRIAMMCVFLVGWSMMSPQRHMKNESSHGTEIEL